MPLAIDAVEIMRKEDAPAAAEPAIHAPNRLLFNKNPRE